MGFEGKSESTTRELISNSFVVGVGTISSKALAFLLVPLYSLWLVPTDYGLYDLVASYVALCVPFATLQLEQAVYRNSISDPSHAKDYFTTAAKLIIPLLMFVAMFVYIVASLIFHLSFALEFTSYFVSLAVYNLTTEYVRGLRELKVYSIANLLSGILIVSLSILLVGFYGLGLRGVIVVYPISYTITSIALLIKYRPWTNFYWDWGHIKEMLKFSVPLIPNNIAWWVTNVSNRTVISVFLGPFYNGLFAISSKIPTFLSLFFGVFSLAFQQTAILSIQDSVGKRYFAILFKRLINLLFSSCMLIISIVPFIYKNFISEAYWDGIYCVPLLLAGASLLSLAQYLGDILMAERKTTLIGTSTMVAAITNIGINILMIQKLGIMASAIAAFIGYLFMLLMRLVTLSTLR